MSDVVNELMLRCEAARQKADTNDEFNLYWSSPDASDTPREAERRWWVGFYCSSQGKMNATGPTLQQALENWLQEYEHWWDSNAGSSETTSVG